MVVLSVGSEPFAGRYAVQYGSAVTHALSYLGDMVQVALGALIVIRRPRHPVGWLLLASVSISQLDRGLVSNFVIYAIDVRHRAIPGGDLVGSFQAMLWMLFVVPLAIFLPLVFPTGKLLSRRWRPVVWVGVIAMVVGFLANGLNPNRDATSYITGVHPVSLSEPYAAIAGALSAAFVVLLPVLIGLSIIALVLRYRRGSADERHQIKWLVFAIAVAGSAGSSSLALSTLGHPVPLLQDLDIIGIALIPVAAAIAVLRYRLYDIDVVINRTLVYGALALFITAVYVGIVVGIGTLVGSRGQPNLLLSIVATAIVAVAFQPIRERLQKIANRLVYGKRATPYEVLSKFAEHVAETYSADDALPRMARVLAEGTGAEAARVWLRAGNLLRPAAAWPNSSGAEEPVPLLSDNLPDLPGAESIPVRHQGELLGALTVTKRAGESLTPIEHKLLDDLAHQAGLVLKNVGLTAELLARLEELRASRQRVVAAQDEERRRLERNLHDGAQQHLVAIKIKLGLAESIAVKDPVKTRGMIDQIKADTDEALETVRDLARGIYPPLLADKGLAAALQAQARKATLPVEVDADGIGRYSQDLEAAVYFCLLEALQNTQKYAEASRATVRLRVHRDELRFEVEDDGKGFDPATQKRGSGTQNMEDRLDALGGSVRVRSAVGTGTIVAGSVPVDMPEGKLQPA
jgi:signal transduction histidine kinase